MTMKLIDMTKSAGAVYDGVVSLDGLWAQAAALGTTTIENGFGGQYAQISFERKTGSRVYAKGYASDVREALRLAIDEARELGARP